MGRSFVAKPVATSAVLAYAGGSERVGEPLTQVAETNAAFTVSLAALATAAVHVERAMVDLLTKHPAVYSVLRRRSADHR